MTRCPHCAKLLSSPGGELETVMEWFSIEPCFARLLLALWSATDWMSKPVLAKQAGVALNSAHTGVWRLRAAMDAGAIESSRGHYGRGYRLTETGRAELAAVLAQEQRRAA